MHLIHRCNTPNVGDLNAAPHHYFPLRGHVHDLVEWSGQIRGIVVLGGGGLLHPFFDLGVQRLLEQRPSALVVWGVGVNDSPYEPLRLPDWLAGCDLVGLRDWGTPFDWVPCASCMSPLFDNAPSPTRQIVVFRHHDYYLPELPLPTMDNYSCSMQKAVAFLSSAEIVVTNSYHGAYWATLLGRKVIACPFSNKFCLMRHMPLLYTGNDPLENVASAIDYPGALQECRTATVEFWRKFRSRVWR